VARWRGLTKMSENAKKALWRRIAKMAETEQGKGKGIR